MSNITRIKNTKLTKGKGAECYGGGGEKWVRWVSGKGGIND